MLSFVDYLLYIMSIHFFFLIFFFISHNMEIINV